MRVRIEFFVDASPKFHPKEEVDRLLKQSGEKLEEAWDWPGEYKKLKTNLKDAGGSHVGTVEVSNV